jgi:hypothetical protein
MPRESVPARRSLLRGGEVHEADDPAMRMTVHARELAAVPVERDQDAPIRNRAAENLPSP